MDYFESYIIMLLYDIPKKPLHNIALNYAILHNTDNNNNNILSYFVRDNRTNSQRRYILIYT